MTFIPPPPSQWWLKRANIITVFFEINNIGIIGIFVLLKFENESSLIISHINLISVNSLQILICIRIYLVDNLSTSEVTEECQYCLLYVFRKKLNII